MMPLDNFQPTNLPVTYDTPAIDQTIGAPEKQITQPGFGLSLANSVYGAVAEGPSATIGSFVDTRIVQPYITDRDRPKLDQDKVNTLWASAGIPDKAPDASKYNDVSIYYLLDRAKRRQDMRDVDARTDPSFIGTPIRGAAMLVAGMADPINLAAGVFPVARVAEFVGATGLAAGIRGLEATAASGASLAQRVGARAATGAIEGFVGNVPLEAISAPIRNEMGEDYSATDSLMNLAFGSAIGGGIHIVTGGLSRARIERERNPENSIARQVINNAPEADRARFVAEDGNITPEGNRFIQEQSIAKSIDSPEVAQRVINSSNPEVAQLSDDLVRAGLDTNAEPENIGDLSIKKEMSDAVNDLTAAKEQGVDYAPSELASEVSQKLASFIDSNTTTPRMIAEAINNYHDAVQNISLAEQLTTSKAMLLDQAIRSVQPTAEELAIIATPQTRETVLKTSVGQMMDDKYPTVDSLMRADENIGTATRNDVEREFAQQNNPENNYMTSEVPERNPIQENIPFDDDIDYVLEKSNIDKQIAEVEKLSELGLYSIDQTENIERSALSNKEELLTEFNKQFGSDAQKLLDAGKIEIVDKVTDIPGEDGSKRVKGVTFSDGKVYIAAENVDPVKLKGLVLHEVGVHANLRNFVGDKSFNNIIREMDRIMSENDDIDRIVNAAVPADTPIEHIKEEQLAYMVENLPDMPLVKRLIAKIRAYLYKTFPSIQRFMNLTDQDIGQLAALSLRNYANDNIRANPGDTMYSQLGDVVDETQTELDALNQVIGKTQQYRQDLTNIVSDLFRNIGDRKAFVQDITNLLPYVNADEAKELYNDLSRAYSRYFELGKPNPEQLAINYAMDKLEYGQAAHKLALTHDKAVKNRLNNYLRQWAGFEKNGIDSLLTGTTLQNVPGARAYTLGSEIVNTKRQVTGNMLKDLNEAGLQDAFTKGIFADDTMRAMEALQNNMDTYNLSPEAVQLAKIVQNSYDSITTQMRENGLMTNKVKNYFFNQSNLHAQEKIYAAGFENWLATARNTFDFEAMADAMNISVDQIDNELMRGIYDGLATGEHIGNTGNLGSPMAPGTSFRAVKNKQRVIHFKDANAAIEYRNHFGNRDFASSVIGTIESNSKQLAILKVLGVNYERNLNEVARELQSTIVTPEGRKDMSNYIQNNMQSKLKSVDGRADRAVNETVARIQSNIMAIKSMSSLGFATISAVTDVVNSAAFLNRKGMGRGLVVDSITNLVDVFKPYSQERKNFLSSMGVFSDSIFGNAYRDGNADQSVGKWLSKSQGLFFKITGLDAWTTSSKRGAEDALIHNMGLQAKQNSFDNLDKSLQKQLGLFNINKEEWDLIRTSNLKQLDGREYLAIEEFDKLLPQIENKFSNLGLVGQELETSSNKYLSNLKRNMYNFYMDGLSHMVIEPDSATKYYSTWGGLQPGTPGGVMARLTSQFKSFSIGFVRKVLFDQIYENNNSFIFGTRREGGRFYNRDFSSNYITDFSREGISQKMHMAKYIAALTVAGYVSGAMNDLGKGKEPRPIFNNDGTINKATLVAALLKGGSLGIYGDFMFGDYNRFGGDLLSTAAGPVLGSVNQVASIGSALREKALGNSTADVGSKVSKLLISNTPFVNMFYTAAAFNYSFTYSLQEYLNPGSLRRMERSMKDKNNQEFIFPPSQYAPRW